MWGFVKVWHNKQSSMSVFGITMKLYHYRSCIWPHISLFLRLYNNKHYCIFTEQLMYNLICYTWLLIKSTTLYQTQQLSLVSTCWYLTWTQVIYLQHITLKRTIVVLCMFCVKCCEVDCGIDSMFEKVTHQNWSSLTHAVIKWIQFL